MPLLLLALQAASAPASPDVVVYGKRLDAAHRACAAGPCTVLRDAQVSVALAEQQFRAGAYVRAKETLSSAIARQRGHAASDPKPMAALYEAYATIALHEGDTDAYRRAVGQRVRTLRDHLSADDPAVIAVALAPGDMWVALGDLGTADAAYAAAAQHARDSGDGRSALLAELRRVGLAVAMRNLPRANRMLAVLKADPALADPALQAAVRVIDLRIAARGADNDAIDRLVADIGHAEGTRVALIWAAPYEQSTDAAIRQGAGKFDLVDPVSPRSGEVSTIRWSDIGFWIRPDGRTAEAEVLRGNMEASWARPLLRQIASRRYTGSQDVDGQGSYRIERFTWRGVYRVPTGSLISRRVGPVGLEVLDLTEAPPMSR